MSVCFFGVAELANVAAAVLNGTPKVFMCWSEVADVAYSLSLVSQANAAAYNERYYPSVIGNTCVEPVTKEEIEAKLFPRYVGVAARGQYKCDLTQAVTVAQLLHYNCVDEKDHLESTPGAPVALTEVLQKMMTVCASKAGLLSPGE